MEPLEDTIVSAGEKAELDCEVKSGNPAATIRWFKENKELQRSKKYTMSYNDETAALVVQDAQLVDAGCYRFEASNKLGRVETQCILLVQGMPRAQLFCTI